MAVMITSFDILQDIFAIDMSRTLKSSLKHCRKHVLRSLQLYGNQALVFFIFARANFPDPIGRIKGVLNFNS